MKVKSEREVAQSCPTLIDPMDRSLLSRQEYRSVMPLPSPRQIITELLKIKDRDFPGSSVVKTLHFQCRGARIPSLVRELIPYMLQGAAKIKKNK